MVVKEFFTKRNNLFIIAGPCVIEAEDMVYEIARRLKEICHKLKLPFVFKSSYDKANRTSLKSYRGPGITKGLRILQDVKEKFSIPVLTDVHSPEEARVAAEVVDILQIPAFLCRQTDLVIATSETGKPTNIKKGQFLAPWDVEPIIEKFISTGNQQIMITERGTSFGYNNLIVDIRGIPLMRSFGYPVFFDMTHSLQLPGEKGSCSGGQREFADPLARAAVAAGADGLFMEVHHEPEKALCDSSTMIPLNSLEEMLNPIKVIHEVINRISSPSPSL